MSRADSTYRNTPLNFLHRCSKGPSVALAKYDCRLEESQHPPFEVHKTYQDCSLCEHSELNPFWYMGVLYVSLYFGKWLLFKVNRYPPSLPLYFGLEFQLLAHEEGKILFAYTVKIDRLLNKLPTTKNLCRTVAFQVKLVSGAECFFSHWRSFYKEVQSPRLLLVHPRSQDALQVEVRGTLLYAGHRSMQLDNSKLSLAC